MKSKKIKLTLFGEKIALTVCRHKNPYLLSLSVEVFDLHDARLAWPYVILIAKISI